jgi:site-specific DNA-methyltransferase (adenine-specific)
MVMVAHRAGGKLAWNDEVKAVSNVVRVSKPRDDAHPNVKPLELVAGFIKAHTTANQTILDPFAGSCTTARAAKDLGRKCVCIEREERYCEIGARRMSQEVFDLN